MKPRRVAVLGATGSIGRQTLDFVEAANRQRPGSFEIVALAARSDEAGLREATRRCPGALTALTEPREGASWPDFAGSGALEGLLASCGASVAVNGVAGSPGLRASILALEAGMDLALANKESVVMGWFLLEAEAGRRSLRIIPVDSEHAALFQLVGRIGKASVTELTITASGGPFGDKDKSYLASVGPDEAAAHPVWPMGRKISIDSASLANKGLELIEASRLFGVDESRIKVLIHPQSIVHALVRGVDGSLYAQMSSPDMRIPIGAALLWPEERPLPFPALDLAGRSLVFREPDLERFPMLGLAREALRLGYGGCIAYNAADEVAVEAFDSGRIGFMDIPRVVEGALGSSGALPPVDLGGIFELDAAARAAAADLVLEFSR